jgi:hypothetical protein
MEPIHLAYCTYKDLSFGITSSSKIETVQQIKRGKSYTATVNQKGSRSSRGNIMDN